jgi:hypothetical protein
MFTRILFITMLLVTACSANITSQPGLQENTPAGQVESPGAETAIPSAEPQQELLSAFTRLAIEDLAAHLSLDTESISVVSTKSVIWTDAALGCPLPGQAYDEARVPGFEIWLEAGGQHYVYHVDHTGKVLLCPEVKPDEPGLR